MENENESIFNGAPAPTPEVALAPSSEVALAPSSEVALAPSSEVAAEVALEAATELVKEPAPEPAQEPTVEPAQEPTLEVVPEVPPEFSLEFESEAAPESAETAVLPRESFLQTDTDDPARATLGTPANPIGTLNPEHPIFWHGRNILGTEFQGSALTGTRAILDATALGSATCHLRNNPDFVAPEAPPVVLPAQEPNPATLSAVITAAHAQGFADADVAYQDLKNLCLAFGTEQAALTSDDVEQKYPFVAYARFNR